LIDFDRVKQAWIVRIWLDTARLHESIERIFNTGRGEAAGLTHSLKRGGKPAHLNGMNKAVIDQFFICRQWFERTDGADCVIAADIASVLKPVEMIKDGFEGNVASRGDLPQCGMQLILFAAVKNISIDGLYAKSL